ncbi:hypothetical protein B1R32_102155 [Abditibacterium utsteinense]|uniref:Uncharacterized protein n=1 Tax=Abditibacterium utsteinense TaxID=1960156 RepID=A0A2S8SWI6_9BACT|nr:hypothetical protein [Abditibacterium utsteinense]PQV65147.1 hypothetical protein B1R32_102155 [Abditibacterium utsteinense]
MINKHEPCLVIKNSRTKPMFLGIEPTGWFWELALGDVFEIIFESWEDYESGEPIDIKDESITFWGAASPISVIQVLPDKRVEMMV